MVRPHILLLLLLVACASPACAQSRRGELRGVWMGGGYDRDWPAIMQSLKDNGCNAIFPSMGTGGAALYPSKVLPVAPGAQPGRDELAEAVKAARRYGIELHVGRTGWALERVPEEVRKRYEAEGRLMRNLEGKLVRDDPREGPQTDWLCPSHPDNRKLEKDAVLEVVRRYDVAGIQLDYTRFPGVSCCYCDHCRAQFEKDTGARVEAWPGDCAGEGKRAQEYARWRQGLQTSLVKEISEEAHRIKPGIFISVAVREGKPGSGGPDWPEWVKQGGLDFICFANFGTSAAEVARQVREELGMVGSAIPVYPGLGAFLLKDSAELIDQIKAVREEGADGFVGFAFDRGELSRWLPALGASVASSEPNPMPHWGPPAILSITGPAVLTPEAERKVRAGGKLTADLNLGVPRPAANAVADEGAMQAASILQRASESRQPVGSMEPTEAGTGMGDDTYRLTGRIVLETPEGDPRAVLGAFTAEWQYLKQLTFTVPEGPFRLAVYGTEQLGESQREFVFRSLLLTGVEVRESEGRLPTEGKQEGITQLIADFLQGVRAEELAGLEATVLLRVEGEGGGNWWVRAKEGKCESGLGAIDRPDLTIAVSEQDFFALARGEADPYELWQSGRLSATGDRTLLTRLIPLLWREGGA